MPLLWCGTGDARRLGGGGSEARRMRAECRGGGRRVGAQANACGRRLGDVCWHDALMTIDERTDTDTGTQCGGWYTSETGRTRCDAVHITRAARTHRFLAYTALTTGWVCVCTFAVLQLDVSSLLTPKESPSFGPNCCPRGG